MGANASLLGRRGLKHQVLQGCRSNVGLAKCCLMLSREVLAMLLGRLECSLLGNFCLCCRVSWSGAKHCTELLHPPVLKTWELHCEAGPFLKPVQHQNILFSPEEWAVAGQERPGRMRLVCASWSFITAGACGTTVPAPATKALL